MKGIEEWSQSPNSERFYTKEEEAMFAEMQRCATSGKETSELDDYEKFCATTDVLVSPLRQYTYPPDMYYALGLGGEVGEVLEKIKKSHRDGVLDVRQLELELGDVMWYLSRLANFHGLTLRGVIAANIEKLSSRQERGKLQGSGDNR